MNFKTQPVSAELSGGASPVPQNSTASQKTGLKIYENKVRDKATRLLVQVENLDPLYELDASNRSKFEKKLKDLRLNKLISSLERFGAKRLEFKGRSLGDKALLFKNEESKWKSLSDAEMDLDQDKIQKLLDKLSGNKIRDFLSGSKIPPGETEGVQLLFGDDQSENKRHYVFWKSGASLYARDLKSTKKEALLLDSVLVDAFPWKSEYRDMYSKNPKVPPPSSAPTPPEPGRMPPGAGAGIPPMGGQMDDLGLGEDDDHDGHDH